MQFGQGPLNRWLISAQAEPWRSSFAFLGRWLSAHAQTCAYGLSWRAPRVAFAVDAWTTDDGGTLSLASVWNSNLQPNFNMRIRDSFDASSSVVLRELDESNRFVQKSAESTSI